MLAYTAIQPRQNSYPPVMIRLSNRSRETHLNVLTTSSILALTSCVQQKTLGHEKAKPGMLATSSRKCGEATYLISSNLTYLKTVVEPIPAYGSETWTLKAKEVKRVDGCYANLFRRVQNTSWRKHFTLSQIYGDLWPLSVTLAKRTPQFAGHALRAKGESYLASSFGRTTGRKLTFSDTISRDTGSCSHGK